MKRGRRSTDAMLARPDAHVLDRVQRPTAPHDLTDEEVEVWAAVVNSMPADYFGPESLALLSQYSRHVIAARRVAEWIEKATADPELRVKDFGRLLRLQAQESAALSALAVKMRIAQQSSRTDRGHARGARGPGKKPWE
jgi:hypothetical protein